MSKDNWQKYKNGNVTVFINLDDGTKIRTCPDNEEYHPEFPENADVTISTYCTNRCDFCYAGCSQFGSHADLLSYKTLFDSLRPNTELAVNINSELNPQFVGFLTYMRDKGVIVNATLRQDDFERNHRQIEEWCGLKLLRGVGISLLDPTDKFIELVKKNSNYVIHTIAGITTMEQYNALADNGLKILILGYKKTRRGQLYYDWNWYSVNARIKELKTHLSDLMGRFRVISFDNMAIEQLDFRSFLTPKEFEEFYMGEEGSFTMAIDLVNGTYASSSTSDVLYQLDKNQTIDEIFKTIQEEIHRDAE